MKVPERCRLCAHWLGRYSGREDDPRCNRNWGHEARYGDFWSDEYRGAPYGHPALVAERCRVPLWGLPVPFLDEHGNPSGPPLAPVLVDAYLEHRPTHLELRTGQGRLELTPDELREYLRMDEKVRTRLFAARAKRHAETDQKLLAVYKAKTKSAGVITTADQLPPYRRNLERIPTGLVNLDYALKGGLIPGLQIGLWGPPHGGKSTLSDRLMAAIQAYYDRHNPDFRDDEQMLVIAPEGYDVEYAQRQGVDTSRVKHPEFDTAEGYLEYMLQHLKADESELRGVRGPDTYSYDLPVSFRCIKVDSIDMLTLWEDEHGAKDAQKTLIDNEKTGAQAQLLARTFRRAAKLNIVPITGIWISQMRSRITPQGGYASGSRGNAHPHFVKLEIRVTAEKPVSDKALSYPVTLEFRQVQFDSNVYAGKKITLWYRVGGGVYPEDQVAGVAMEQGLIVKSGSWYTYTAQDGREVKQQGGDPVLFGQRLLEEGLFQEVYDRVYQGYYGTPIGEAAEEAIEDQSQIDYED